jgi:hypothetical protein
MAGADSFGVSFVVTQFDWLAFSIVAGISLRFFPSRSLWASSPLRADPMLLAK